MSGQDYLCPHCGAQNGPADVFCYSCQKELEREPDPLGKGVRAVVVVILVSLAVAILATWAATAGSMQAPPSSLEVDIGIRIMADFVGLLIVLMTMKGSFWDARTGAAAEANYGFKMPWTHFYPRVIPYRIWARR